MDRETLFLKTLDDIEERSKSQDPYTILGVSALIRKIFLEKHPLVDTVNQRFREKLKFTISAGRIPKKENLPAGSFWSQQDGLDPDTSPPGIPTKILGRKDFFQHVVIATSEYRHTIRDVIRYQAHVVGGVHAGAPEDDKEKALEKIDQLFLIGGHAMATRQLLAVARVILKALSPLRLAIQNQRENFYKGNS